MRRIWSTGQREHHSGPMSHGKKVQINSQGKAKSLAGFKQKDMLRLAILSISVEWGKMSSGLIS